MEILIIKLGAKGDVVRTLSVLPAIKEKFPNSKITWVTKNSSSKILENHPLIDSIKTPPFSTEKKFDILYNFDIEKEATDVAKQVSAEKKLGFSEEFGYPISFNQGAEYYLNTLFDDDLKRENKKTYQEMMFSLAELEFKKQKPRIYLTENEKSYAQKFLQDNNLNPEDIVGIHMGSGKRWPSKAWAPNKIKNLIIELNKIGKNVLLFGGPDEIDTHKKLVGELKSEGIRMYKNNPNNTDREFFSLISLPSTIVCSDSFALHIALSFEKPTICLFFVTSPDEIEGYGILKKVVSPMLYDYFPEKSDQYSEELVNSISVSEVLSKLN